MCEAGTLWGLVDLVHHFVVRSASNCCAEWTPENQSRLVQLLASEELDITLEEGQRRFQQLCQTLPDIGEHQQACVSACYNRLRTPLAACMSARRLLVGCSVVLSYLS